MRDVRHRRKEPDRFVDFHLQHITDALAAPGDGQRLRSEARAAAGLARHLDVRQEAHADGSHALAFAGGAAAFAGVEGEAARAVAARPRLQRVCKQLPDGVPETDVSGGAGARRLADRRLVDFQHPVDCLVTIETLAADPGRMLAPGVGVAAGLGVALLHHRLHVVQQHVARECRLARAGNAGDGNQSPQRHVDIDVLQVVQVGAAQFQLLPLPVHHPSRLHRMLHCMQQVAAGHRFGNAADVAHLPLGHHAATALAGAWADVDDVVGAADGVFVVLHHHQRVALLAQLVQRVQQDLVVARVQADGRLVEHVADALQVGAQLCREADALCLPAREGGGAAVQGQVTQSHLFQEFEPALDLGNQVARDPLLTHAQHVLRLQAFDPATHFHDRQGGNLGDAGRVELHVARLQVQPAAMAGGTSLVRDTFHLGLAEGLLAALGGVVVADGVVEHLALLSRQGHAGPDAVRAPAVLAVVGEQARVELGVAGAANRAGASHREHLDLADVMVLVEAGEKGSLQAIERRQNVQHPFAVLQRLRQLRAQQALVGGCHVEVAHRQLDGVFLEAVEAGKAGRRQEVAIHPQVGIAPGSRPVGQLGVDALAVDHQRRQQADMLSLVARHQLRGDAIGRLRLDLGAVVDAVLHAELDVQQAQEVPDLRGGADGGLAPTARETLLDRDCRRNAVHRIDLWAARRLHDAAGIGVQRFQIAALALVEQDVERQRGLART